MKLMTATELKGLISAGQGLCVSLFMPVSTGAEVKQNEIRAKNLLRLAGKDLLEKGLNTLEAGDFMNPVTEFFQNTDLRNLSGKGLALFRSLSTFQTYVLPIEVDDRVAVGLHFHIRPLIRILAGDGIFFVLALSQKMVRVYEATRSGMKERTVEGMPENFSEAMKYNDPERQLQLHSSGAHAAIFHGHGTGIDDQRENLEEFCRQIDRALHSVLATESSPLILASVESLQAIYRKMNTYSNLQLDGVNGNPDLLNPRQLQDRAWPIVQPYFKQAQVKAHQRYVDLAGTSLVSENIREILPVAQEGRIDTAFVALESTLWGRFDPMRNEVIVHVSQEEGDEDLLNLVAVSTLLRGGTVYPAWSGQTIAAIYRY